jgi:putative 4-mercaptohistidine N1-methyltranferase
MNNPYESQKLLNEYLLFHYGQAHEILPWTFGPKEALFFPTRCASFISENSPVALPKSRALDVGCAVGRLTFHLAQSYREAIGIDFSASFITAAQTLARGENLEYPILQTGRRTHPATARAPELPLDARLSFETGDAQNLRVDLGSFDLVSACNLLCRLPQPQKFLDRLPSLVNPGGLLLITTPNTWLEEFTAPEYWIGATPETGEPLEALTNQLSPGFQLLKREDKPFLICEHARKFQWSVAEATLWQRLA